MRSCMKISQGEVALYAEGEEGLTLLKVADSYYRPTSEQFETIKSSDRILSTHVIRDCAAPLVLMSLLVLSGLFLPLLPHQANTSDVGLGAFAAFVALNILAHEGFHAAVLHAFYPGAKTRPGFRLTFIFPTFYVDTSDSYLLPTYKRLAVYLAGNAANGLLVTLAYLVAPKLAGDATFISATMAINLLPIMKSDGYYLVETLRGHYNRHKSSQADFVENFARGALAFCALYLISAVARLVL